MCMCPMKGLESPVWPAAHTCLLLGHEIMSGEVTCRTPNHVLSEAVLWRTYPCNRRGSVVGGPGAERYRSPARVQYWLLQPWPAGLASDGELVRVLSF